MRRDTGRHTDRDPLCTVDQKIRHSRRKHKRFFFCLVKIRTEIHDILIQICQIHFLCKFRQACFGITHCGGAVPLDRAEVSMSVHKDHAFLKFLRHHDKRVINRAVAVRMIFTHRISDDTGTFPIRFVVSDPQFIHIIQCPALHRFQSVPHIRQRPGNDHTHRVVDI